MTKIWTTEADYPESRMVIYDEAASTVPSFQLKEGQSAEDGVVLNFRFPKKIVFSKEREFDVLWSNILVPLVSAKIRNTMEDRAIEHIQFISCSIKNGDRSIDGFYYLINPTQTVNAVDEKKSEPLMVKIPGAADAKLGFKKLVLKQGFPENGIARQVDALSNILVG